ncbi:hypothetical protein [Belliella aquatica]|uniref:Lipoprotein n=1 Tax=Belliella aquatica TaxID=1323734 RepID=A0ABQ1M0X8_9BACT|nr:hypothetical protein [Belliella aquatica]MCH7406826.1 hypothetical protein [Belliella aquatica]GGC32432.1 hypothetical protein GCM10010993_09260 [Belliella aquatica]
MNKYFIFLVLVIFSCSKRDKLTLENFPLDEVIAIDTFTNTPDFSERFQSFDNESPIWQFNKNIVPEELIEKINEDKLLINGQKLNDISEIKTFLEANDYDEIRQEVWLRDSSITIIIQNSKINSLSFTKSSNLKYEDLDLFSLTPLSYKKKFPGSYKMRNFTTLSNDVIRYSEIDSVKSLDFTYLHTNSGKLTITWVNGKVERTFYKYFH